MKNIIFITFVLIFNISFSQNDLNLFFNQYDFKDILENTYKNTNTTQADQLLKINTIHPSNNSEGKFPLYTITESDQKKMKETFMNKNLVDEVVNKNTKKQSDFIDKLIVKIIKDKNIELSDFYGSIDLNGDKNLDAYKNNTENINKLIIAYKLLEDVDFQIGNDIEKSMNKLLKTDIDKTLNSSLNLLVINF